MYAVPKISRCLAAGTRRRKCGFTLIELLVTVLTIQVISAIVLVSVGNVEATERTDRAYNETIVALRYARMLAMTSGQSCGVEFDTQASRIRVFMGVAMTTVNNSQISGGSYIIDLKNQTNVRGVTLTGISIVGDTTNPYQVWYGTLGQTNNTGTVTFTYGTCTKTLNIPSVGECQ